MTYPRRPGYCQELVYVRDCYRVSHGISSSGRRTSAHMTMHYNKQQCSRKIPKGVLYCWQHRKKEMKE